MGFILVVGIRWTWETKRKTEPSCQSIAIREGREREIAGVLGDAGSELCPEEWSQGGCREHSVSLDVKTCTGLDVGAGGSSQWKTHLMPLRLKGFLFSSCPFDCAFFQPPFAGTFHVLTTCVAWSLHQWGSHVSLLPTQGKAFGHLLPVMPALFFRLSTDPSLFRHHSVVQGRHQGGNEKSCGWRWKKEDAQMVLRVLNNWIMLEILYRGDWSCSNYLLLCNKTPQNVVELKWQPLYYALHVVDGSGGYGSSLLLDWERIGMMGTAWVCQTCDWF